MPESVERKVFEFRQMAGLRVLLFQRRQFDVPASRRGREDPVGSRRRTPHFEYRRASIRERNGPPGVCGFPGLDMKASFPVLLPTEAIAFIGT